MSARRRTDDEPRMSAAEVKEARRRMSETVEGGKYLTDDGRWVNAWGEEISASGKAKAGDD